MSDTKKHSDAMQGEGNYDAARNFDKAEAKFVQSGAVPENARKAADALDGPEGAELEAARVKTAKGDTSKSKP
jgi:hypothetical protein